VIQFQRYYLAGSIELDIGDSSVRIEAFDDAEVALEVDGH
jgi:hypothetical protein